MAPKSKRRTVAERFWSKVSGGDVDTCWVWTASINKATGYGHFGVSASKFVVAHRFSYEFLRAEIPAGLQIDHLCRNRACVNPWHLEPVTPRVNVLRSTNPAAVNARRESCVNGHPLTEDNIYRVAGKSHRTCATCHREKARGYYHAKKAASLTGGAR